MTTFRKAILSAVACIGLLGAVSQASAAQPAACTSYAKVKLGVSIYVGWQPWYWANQTGLIQAEGKKRCLDIEVQEFTDYGASIDAYTSGQLDALTITNMDAMMSPVNSGVDTTAIIVGDYSNGNDAVLSREATSVKDLKGKQIFRVQQSVTDYLIERALEKNNMTAADVDLQNLSENAHVSTFKDAKINTVGTWNPYTLTIKQLETATAPVHDVFDSSEIPGEIQDLLVVNTKTLKAHPAFGNALTATWYQAMAKMEANDQAALSVMAATSPTSLDNYKAMLSTTAMYYKPADAAAFAHSKGISTYNAFVYKFLTDSRIMDKSPVGISFPNGTVLGNAKNVKFRFDATYMDAAAAGTLN